MNVSIEKFKLLIFTAKASSSFDQIDAEWWFGFLEDTRL